MPGADPVGTGEGDGSVADPAFLIDAEVELALSRGSRVILMSDLHLPAAATATSTAVADELAEVLGRCEGPATLVIAGDGFEMLAGPPDIEMILDAHRQLTEAIARFAGGEDRHVVVLSGNHDGQLAWDGASVAVLRDRLHAETFALACNLLVGTDQGVDKVRVVHGNQADPASMVDGFSLDLMRRTNDPDAPMG